MPYITVGEENSGSIELYYEDHGAGRPVILIHGWPLSGASWEKQSSALLAAGYRVITYDRRGFGNSSKPTSGYNYGTLAGDLRKIITKLNLRDVTLAGFSMGGGEVARYLGLYGSQNVSQAVFISAIPPYLLQTADNPEGAPGSVFAGIEQAIVADRPAFLSQFLHNFYNVDVLGGTRISNEAVQLSWNVAVNASPKGTLDCVAAWLEDFRGDLAKIDIPTLVIHGDTDRILPFPVTAKRTHETVKGSTLVTIEGGPHGVLWTHADAVNPALLDFLEQKTPATQKAAATR